MEINKSTGAVSKVLLAMAIVIFIIIMAAFAIIRFAQKPPKPVKAPTGPPLPVYQLTIGPVQFNLVSSENLGNVLPGSQVASFSRYRDLTTNEKFIKVVIGAQNEGKESIIASSWNVGDIIDSAGRRFSPDTQANPWLPDTNACSNELEPAFAPTSCTKIYEVAKVSDKLKVEVSYRDLSNELGAGKMVTELIDLLFNSGD